jgi:hypothetical protein
LLLAQGARLLFQEGLRGALGEAGGGGAGGWLQGLESDVESGPAVAWGVSGDDFAPACGEVVELLKFLGSERASCRAASCLEVETKRKEKMAPGKVRPRTSGAKRFMTSWFGTTTVNH